MERICLWCGIDISNKDGKAKTCCKKHSIKYFNKLKSDKKKELKKNRFCLSCNIDISNKNIQAKYCSRNCKNKYHRKQNPEHYRKLKRDLYAKNPEKFRKQTSEWRKNNPEKIKMMRDNWRKNNPEILNNINMKSAIKNNHKEKTKFWDKSKRGKLREEFNKLKNNKCEICDSNEDLQVHHKKYTNNFKDWMLVCRSCHYNIHKDL